ncbi:MAG: ElyC/SanA/YdcF family protein [Chloroflexota bacterium]
MIRTVLRKTYRVLLIAFGLGVFALILPHLILLFQFYGTPDNQQIFSVEDVPYRPVAIVFGAGLRRDSTPTSILRERVTFAADLYHAGKVQKILMSGDNREIYYNEPESMRQYALDLGVPNDAIVLDYAGLRTYDTCYRAREIFGVKEAILVTQDFHMPRALYTCNALNLPSIGVIARKYHYSPPLRFYWYVRESFATLAAFWDVKVARPLPILGKPEPIFTSSGRIIND